MMKVDYFIFFMGTKTDLQNNFMDYFECLYNQGITTTLRSPI